MNPHAALFLQVVVILIGLAALTFLLGEPHLEGRNARATPFEIYFKDPFLAYVYVGSIPFFVALHRAFGLLGRVRETGAFTSTTVKSLRTIKTCALISIGVVAGAAIFIFRLGDGEDRPAGIVMCLFATLVAAVAALVASRFARSVQTKLEHADRFSV